MHPCAFVWLHTLVSTGVCRHGHTLLYVCTQGARQELKQQENLSCFLLFPI